MCCDSNLDPQSNLPYLGAWLIDLISFFLWKMMNIVLEYWKLLKLCFIIEKTFGLLGLYVIVKGIASWFLEIYGCLRISRDISLALNKLVSVSDLGFFHFSNVFFSSLKSFSFSTMVHILIASENGIFVKQCQRWFDVNGTYRFKSVGFCITFIYHNILKRKACLIFFHSELNIVIRLNHCSALLYLQV